MIKKNWWKYTVYVSTVILHFLTATTFLHVTGHVGFVVMVSHWIFFKGCCISHIERYIHIKLVGESHFPDVWRTCMAHKLFSRLHPIFK